MSLSLVEDLGCSRRLRSGIESLSLVEVLGCSGRLRGGIGSLSMRRNLPLWIHRSHPERILKVPAGRIIPARRIHKVPARRISRGFIGRIPELISDGVHGER